jgi:hypothetical protein
MRTRTKKEKLLVVTISSSWYLLRSKKEELKWKHKHPYPQRHPPQHQCQWRKTRQYPPHPLAQWPMAVM